MGGRVGAALFGLAYIAVAARRLGPEDFGVLTLIHAYTITLGGMIVIPGWQAVVRFGAAAHAEGRSADLARLFRFAALVEVASGLVAVAVVAAGTGLAAGRLGWPAAIVPMAALYSLAVFGGMRSTPTGVLYLFNRVDLAAATLSVGPAVRLLGSFAVILLDGGLSGFLIAWLAGGLAECAAQWSVALLVAARRGYLPDLRRRGGALPRGVWPFMLATNFDQTLSDLWQRLGPLAVGWLLGPASAGLYQLATRLGMALAQPAQIVAQSAFPELSRRVAAADFAGVRRLLVRSSAIVAAAGAPVLLVFILFGPALIRLVAGDGFEGAYIVLVLVGIARLVQLASSLLNPTLVALGSPGAALRWNAIVSAAMLPVLVLLTKAGGLFGAGLHAILQATALGIALLAMTALELRHRTVTPTA